MKLVVTALQLEARAFVDGLGLKRDPGAKRIQIYRSGEIILAVSGTGKINSASATAWALEYLGFTDHGEVSAINFGLCGCPDPAVPAGSLFLVHKITDKSSGRTFFPDLLHKHGYLEASLETHDRAVTSAAEFAHPEGSATPQLVDMEASGFFGAASRFLPPDRISCLKIVSDHLEGIPLDQATIKAQIEAKWADLERFLGTATPDLPQPPGMSAGDIALIDELSATLRLTETQGHQIRDWARSFTIRSGGIPLPLQRFRRIEGEGKAWRNKVLRDIRNELLAS